MQHAAEEQQPSHNTRDDDPSNERRRDRQDSSDDHQYAECNGPPCDTTDVGQKCLRHIDPPMMATNQPLTPNGAILLPASARMRRGIHSVSKMSTDLDIIRERDFSMSHVPDEGRETEQREFSGCPSQRFDLVGADHATSIVRCGL